MPEVQPVEYNEVTRAVPETGIRKAVSGIAGYRFPFGHAMCPLYKNSREAPHHLGLLQISDYPPEYRDHSAQDFPMHSQDSIIGRMNLDTRKCRDNENWKVAEHGENIAKSFQAEGVQTLSV